MDCFKGLIALRGICDASAGEVINDLPGISLKMVSNLTDGERASFADVYNDAENYAIAQMKADMLPTLSKYMLPNVLAQNYQSSQLDTPFRDVAASAEYKGVAIEHDGSKYAKFVVNDVQLYSDAAGSYTVKVFDYNDGRELDSFTGDLVAGLNTITINKTYNIQGQNKRIFVAYDGTSIDSKTSDVYDSNIVEVRGAKVAVGTTPIRNNLSFTGDTFGLSVNFNLECSLDLFACQYRDMLKTALKFKIGDALMLYRLASDRVNQYTMVGEEKAQELRELYQANYEKNLNAVLDSISPAAGDVCFPCNNRRNYKYNMP